MEANIFVVRSTANQPTNQPTNLENQDIMFIYLHCKTLQIQNQSQLFNVKSLPFSPSSSLSLPSKHLPPLPHHLFAMHKYIHTYTHTKTRKYICMLYKTHTYNTIVQSYPKRAYKLQTSHDLTPRINPSYLVRTKCVHIIFENFQKN